ncbi:hypothetical protein [Nocardia sp. CY41]|uniref:hypothetical protein n=1 Tax=Nocardia sp. CY41 TaxID=2608686 RepID=UPI0013582B88|nr:hypothetical protein [Nocardia sp. CY41]
MTAAFLRVTKAANHWALAARSALKLIAGRQSAPTAREPFPTDLERWLARMATAQHVRHASGYVDQAAELAVRAIVVAVASAPLYNSGPLHGVREVLKDHAAIYRDAAWAWLNDPVVGDREAVQRRVTVLEDAADRVTALRLALETKFATRF